MLDNVVISAPVINEPIPGGNVQISSGGLGGFSRAEADELVNVLRFGSLPFPVEELASDTIDPTLGQEFLNASLLAGGDRDPARDPVHAHPLPAARPRRRASRCMYYALLVLALFRLIPVTLTLAGIAGFVLSVGMAVDANILIFERTKEELRSGKSLPQAIEAGFARAWNSILDSNVSSLITASILYLFGSSVIQGFALVLIIGVLVLDVHRDHRDPDDPAPRRRSASGRARPGCTASPRRSSSPDRRPATLRREAERCLTSSASAAGSSSSRR